MTIDVVDPPTVRQSRPLVASAAVVSALVAAEVLLGHEMIPLERWVGARVDERSALDAWGLLFTLLRWAVLAVWLAAWGLTPRRRLVGAAMALLGGVVEWGINEGYFRLFYNTGHNGPGALSVYYWAIVLLVPMIAALAWGLARRQGRQWPLGLVVAPLLAWLYAHDDRSGGGFSRWVDGSLWWLKALIVLAPAVLGGIACWLLERHELEA